MDPNSANQTWSRWTWEIVPSRSLLMWTFPEVRTNCARFAKRAFGLATQMRVTQVDNWWRVDTRTEGHPAHDPSFRAWMLGNWDKFLRAGFGSDSKIDVEVKVEAGSLQDGTPSQQLIIMPTIEIEPEVVAALKRARRKG